MECSIHRTKPFAPSTHPLPLLLRCSMHEQGNWSSEHLLEPERVSRVRPIRLRQRTVFSRPAARSPRQRCQHQPFRDAIHFTPDSWLPGVGKNRRQARGGATHRLQRRQSRSLGVEHLYRGFFFFPFSFFSLFSFLFFLFFLFFFLLSSMAEAMTTSAGPVTGVRGGIPRSGPISSQAPFSHPYPSSGISSSPATSHVSTLPASSVL